MLRPLFCLLCLLSFIPSLLAQDADSVAANSMLPSIFVDCDFCDETYLRRQLNFANHVRDQSDADVYILITSQSTGSGGRSYNISFEGKNAFDGVDHMLTHATQQDETDDERREGRTKVIKMGLMPYLALAGQSGQFAIDYNAQEGARIGLGQDDPWNNWVFTLFVGGGYDGEERQQQYEFESGAFIRRITEDFKIVADLDVELEQENFESGDEQIRSRSSEVDADLGLVKSINRFWSYGLITGFRSTTFRNIKGRVDFNPAIEFNFFPWEESDRRLVTLAYFPGIQHVVYNDETIFGKTSETILSHTLRMQVDFEQPWGEVFAQLEGSHLLNDFKKNRLEFFTFVDVRIARGLSVFARGSFELIHDQLFLPKGDATLEEVLLRRRRLQTDFEVSVSGGLRLTFGSKYNNVVNQRL